MRAPGVIPIMTLDPENIKAILATQFNDFGKGKEFHNAWALVTLLPSPHPSLTMMYDSSSSETGYSMQMAMSGVMPGHCFGPNSIVRESVIYMCSRTIFQR